MSKQDNKVEEGRSEGGLDEEMLFVIGTVGGHIYSATLRTILPMWSCKGKDVSILIRSI